MSDGYLDSIIQVVAPYQASYLPTPIADLPSSGCVLPSLTVLPSALGNPEPPGTLKNCVPLFTAFPIIPAPYSIPENCPDGITFENTNVGIFAQSSDSEPTAVITVGVTQNDNFCSYSLNIPDIVIPCFPAGPQFNGSATITVSDPNTSTVKIGSISIAKSDEVACDWSLQGNIDIELPAVPCQSGITFQSTTLPIYNQVGTLVASPLVSISSNDNPCLFEIEMPNLVIPCYPTGPSVTGGVSIKTVDTSNDATVSTQALSFTQSILNPCSFTLTGPEIIIDVPCSTTGTSLTFSSLQVKDPNNGNSITTTAIPAATNVDGNQCELNVALPVISIPCSTTGINISGSTIIMVGGSGSYEVGYTNVGTANGCTWKPIAPTLDLPTLNCPDGEFSYGTSGLSVRVNGSGIPTTVTPNSAYSTLSLSAPVEGCGVNLGGTLNLQIPCPGGLGVSSNSTIAIVNSDNQTVGSIGLSFENCAIGFSNATTTISGLLPCSDPVTPTSTVVFKNSDGSINSSSTLSLGGSLCNLGLAGTIQFPSVSGSGIQEWNPFGTNNGVVFSPSTEGGMDMYTPTAGTTPTGKDIPGASSKWTHLSSASLTPFEVIKSNTVIPSITVNQTDATLIATQTDCVVKVNPVSYLYSSPTNNTADPTYNRLPIFGLDMPFLLQAGEMVYLEVVHVYVNGETLPTPMYGAICKGLAYDFAITLPDSSTIAVGGAATPNLNYKTITKQTLSAVGITSSSSLSLGYNIDPISTYITQSINNYVGMDQFSGPTYDLFLIQALAIKNILAQTVGSLTTPWQFKTFEVIAYAETNNALALPSGANPVIPRKTGGVQLSFVSDNNTQCYTVKQNVNKHQVIRAVNTTSSANIPIYVLGDYSSIRGLTPYFKDSTGNFAQPECKGISSTITNPTTITTDLTGFDTNNFTSATNSSVLLTRLNTVVSTASNHTVNLNWVKSVINPVAGNQLMDVKVYYTTDGSQPTINTLINPACYRYEGIDYTFTNPVTTPSVRLTWMGVYPEFSIGSPAIVTANTADVNDITWGNEVNG